MDGTDFIVAILARELDKIIVEVSQSDIVVQVEILLHDSMSIACQVDNDLVPEQGSNFFHWEAFGLWDVKEDHDERDDAQASVDKIHSPLDGCKGERRWCRICDTSSKVRR